MNARRALAPSSPWATGDLSTILWPDVAGLPISRAAAMSVPACARARNLITGTLSSAPLSEWHNGQIVSPPRSLLTQPDPLVPRAVTITWTVDDLLFHGVSYWVVLSRAAASDGGRPLTARRVDVDLVELDADEVTPVRYAGQEIAAEDWIVFRGPHEGVLTFGARELSVAWQLSNAARRFANIPMPAVELHDLSEDGLSPDDREQMVADWTRAREASGVGYTNRALELRTHGWNAGDLQLVEARQYSAAEVARLMGVPASSVDAVQSGSTVTYSSLVDARRDLVDLSLNPYAEAIAGRLSMDDVTERGRQVVMRLDSVLLRASFADRMAAYSAAIDSGVYTLEELTKAEKGRPGEYT